MYIRRQIIWLFYCSRLHVITIVSFAAKPNISVTDTSYCELSGSDITLACTIIATPFVSKILWQKYNNGQYNDIPIDGVKCTGASVKAPSLFLSDSKTSDSGIYRCVATNFVDISYSEDVSVSIKGSEYIQINIQFKVNF